MFDDEQEDRVALLLEQLSAAEVLPQPPPAACIDAAEHPSDCPRCRAFARQMHECVAAIRRDRDPELADALLEVADHFGWPLPPPVRERLERLAQRR